MSDTVRAVLLLECYVTVTLLAPLLLGRLPLVAQRPVAMLAAWHGFLVTAVLSLGSGLGLLIHQGVAMQAGADAERVAVVVPLAYAAAGVLGILLFRIVEEGGRVVRDARHRAGEVATLLLASRPYRVAGRDARLVESDVPLAALSPATGVILLTTEARARLDDDELAAVIEHETAHLEQRHALAVRLAQVSRAILPALPASQRLALSTTIAIEFIADDHAARVAGPATVADALAKLDPEGGLSGLRADRMRHPRGGHRVALRTLCAVACALPALPLLIVLLPVR
ncbi:M56 family metallopeptidase [Clavibacter tessellarius]|uniref:Peptidase n=1 Tax=Clavibacter tessellarius TaxID=31965 RepID=A0A225CJM1_9MICO|nr:M56 family metallopeptidase [Clavibacter michiganensis]MBT1636419.1 M56 family metallopeptidase [Clavibacter michiganensis]OQJ62596.1 peptidase [Clavibacter michiganensis subsp. tessellarius]UKF34415.1 M56 family metallopeptidase [Clavibacter michiganensis subsp. tessellarius]